MAEIVRLLIRSAAQSSRRAAAGAHARSATAGEITATVAKMLNEQD